MAHANNSEQIQHVSNFAQTFFDILPGVSAVTQPHNILPPGRVLHGSWE